MQFGSDNHTGAAKAVLDAIIAANDGHLGGYGSDPWTAKAVAALKEVFECDLEAHFVGTGTAANSLALACLVQPWEVVLCHAEGHVLNDESTAPEFFSGGARLCGISDGDDKLTPPHLTRYFERAGTMAPHNAQARALSLSQIAENGLVYSPAEVTALCELAHRHGVSVHMDGARFANAVAALGCTPAEISWKAGVDVLCLGASKNGALAAEAVIFFKPGLSEQFINRRKRAGHLLSKGRFYGAQFAGWLQDGQWLQLAAHANAQGARLAQALATVPGVRLAWPVRANEVFAVMPEKLMQHLHAAGAVFYPWPKRAAPNSAALQPHEALARLVASFATSDGEIAALQAALRDYRPE